MCPRRCPYKDCSNNYNYKFKEIWRLRHFFIVSFILSDRFRCFVLISHLKSLFSFSAGQILGIFLWYSSWNFTETYKADYFGPKSNFCASHLFSGKIWYHSSIFISIEPNIFQLVDVSDNLMGCVFKENFVFSLILL